MAQYFRSFIMLKSDKPGYGINGRTPSGRCILETRGSVGKISLQVQDLKPNILYKTYIITVDDSGSKGVSIGKLVVDEKGKGEFKREVDPNNIEGKEIVLDTVNVVVLIVGEDSQNTPLVGYKDKDLAWKFNFKDMSKVEIEEENEEEFAVDAVAEIFEEVAVKDAETEDNLQEANAEDEATEILEAMEVKNEIEEKIEEEPIFATTMEICENIEEKISVEIEELTKEVEETDDATVNAQENQHILTEKDCEHCEMLEAPTLTEGIAEKTVNAESIEKIDVEDIKEELVAKIAEILESEKEHESVNIEKDSNNAEKQEQYAKAEDFFDDVETENKSDNQEILKTMAHNLKNEENELKYFKLPSDENENNKEVEQTKKATESKPEFKINDEVEFIFQNNIEIKPFKNQRKKIKWVRISLKELAVLPIDFWEFRNHPMIISSYRKNNHLILGVEENKTPPEYFLGVPSAYDKGYKLKASELGFKQFKGCNNSRPSEGEWGYWLLKL